jgi:hypothetical protein
MADATQTVIAVSIPTLAVLIGILVNNSRLGDLNSRLGDLRAYMDARFTGIDRRLIDMEALFTEKLLRVEQVMDVRLKHLAENR